MGTGVGRGDSRAMEAAQQAISSPLLDNISITGATGLLVNITGGPDVTLGEVTQISEIIHEAVGDEAEVIFGNVIEPSMQGEVRVTVIATGFDRQATGQAGQLLGTGTTGPVRSSGGVIQFPQRLSGMQRAVGGTPAHPALGGGTAQPPPLRRPSTGGSGAAPPAQSEALPDMEIPTFIRRQMD
jgi:cell division protein FtsZ